MSKDHKNDFYVCNIDSSKVTYYSYLAKSQLEGYENVYKHFEKLLLIIEQKKWLWIIDGKDYKILNGTIESNFDLKCIRKLMQMMEMYYTSLENIIIINPSLNLKQILSLVYPFLNSDLKKKIIYK